MLFAIRHGGQVLVDSYPLRHGGQVLVDTHLPLIPATQKPFEA